MAPARHGVSTTPARTVPESSRSLAAAFRRASQLHRRVIERRSDATDERGSERLIAAGAGNNLQARRGRQSQAGYTRQNGAWEPDTHTPTRLEDGPTVTLRLARERDGAVVPYAEADTVGRAWSLSEVTIAERHVSACVTPPGLGDAATRARAGWGRWERDNPGCCWPC